MSSYSFRLIRLFFYGNGKTFRDHIYFRCHELYRSIIITMYIPMNFLLPRHPCSLHYTYIHKYTYSPAHTLHTHISCQKTNLPLRLQLYAYKQQRKNPSRIQLRRTRPRRNQYKFRNENQMIFESTENPFAARSILQLKFRRRKSK